jgi:hypothetical protein
MLFGSHARVLNIIDPYPDRNKAWPRNLTGLNTAPELTGLSAASPAPLQLQADALNGNKDAEAHASLDGYSSGPDQTHATTTPVAPLSSFTPLGRHDDV